MEELLITDCLSRSQTNCSTSKGKKDGANHSQLDFAELLSLYSCIDLVSDPIYLKNFLEYRLCTDNNFADPMVAEKFLPWGMKLAH